MSLTPLAQKLLNLHAQQPQTIYYGTDALGSVFKSGDIENLDRAYAELVREGLMEPAHATVSYFGTPKSLHRLTDAGKELAQEVAT